MPRNSLARLTPQRPPSFGSGLGQVKEGLREALGVARRYDPPRVADDLLNALDVACLTSRFGKVVHPDDRMIRAWMADLRAGRPIHPFADAVAAPVPATLAVEALYRLGEGRYDGLYQLSATADASYAAIAERLARRLGADPALVRPKTAAAAGWTGAPFPRHTTLDSTALAEAVGRRRPIAILRVAPHPVITPPPPAPRAARRPPPPDRRRASPPPSPRRL